MNLLRLSLPAFAAMLASPATAHVYIDNPETKGGSFKAVFNVPHGCEGSATTSITITIPEGVIGVKPIPKFGWMLTTTQGAYAKMYEHFHGRKVADGVKTVTWSGGKLLNEHLDEFTLGLFVTKDIAPGATLYFPVAQTCETGAAAWSEIPLAGEDGHDLKFPAPSLRIIDVASAAAHAKH